MKQRGSNREAGAARPGCHVQRSAYGLAAATVISLIGFGSLRVAGHDSAQAATPPSRTYATTGFFAGGMTVQLGKGWKVLEDSPMHFSATANDPDYRVLWSIDDWPVHAGMKVRGVPSVAEPLIRWLRANRELNVVEARGSKIGSKLPARVVSVTLGPNAVNDDPGCPAKACVNFLRFYGAAEPYGIAGDDAIRFYFANIKNKGKHHLLIVAIEARNRADLIARLPAAERLIRTVTLAVQPG